MYKRQPVGIGLATGGVLQLDSSTESAASELTQDLAESAIAHYQKDKAAVAEFREGLQALASDSSKPLVVLIDELDRCRPDYAVRMLERIKHLFGVDGVVFVLGIDRVQLGHSVRSMFGQEMDVDGYLRRFIDLSCPLPHVPLSDFVKQSIAHYGLDAKIEQKSKFRFRGGDPRYLSLIHI